ncbi:hypothetical protein DDV22_10770, partial [Streptococcus chenjunshii]
KSYGTFFLQSKSSIISRVELPTTEIIEPKKRTIYASQTGLSLYRSFFNLFLLLFYQFIC